MRHTVTGDCREGAVYGHTGAVRRGVESTQQQRHILVQTLSSKERAMNRYITAVIAAAAAITIIPAIPVYISGRMNKPAAPHTAVIPEAEMPEQPAGEGFYKVLDVNTGEVMKVPVRDYLIGAAAAEMPASFEPEALKAQIVAAHTYAVRQVLREKESPTPELCGADLSNDTAKYQGCLTDSQIRHYYGTAYEGNMEKLSSAVDEVMPYIMTYAGEPIIAAFHSMSSGVTESAENAWGTPVDYLVPVDSAADTEAPRYSEEARYPQPVLEKRLTDAFPGVVLGEDMTGWVVPGRTTPSGTVLDAAVGDMTVTGSDLRTALGLRSACFTVTYRDGEAVFTTHGFGHGVGMSQYGANAMAKSGSSWREILEHYYPGCCIVTDTGM